MDNNQMQNGNTNNSYQQNNYQQPTYQPPVVIDELAHKKDSLPTTSLVLGIIGLVFCWCFFIPIILCLIGLIMGIMSMAKTKQNTGIALGGVITSAIGLAVSCVISFFYFLAI